MRHWRRHKVLSGAGKPKDSGLRMLGYKKDVYNVAELIFELETRSRCHIEKRNAIRIFTISSSAFQSHRYRNAIISSKNQYNEHSPAIITSCLGYYFIKSFYILCLSSDRKNVAQFFSIFTTSFLLNPPREIIFNSIT